MRRATTAARPPGDAETSPLLDVHDLTTHFLTPRGRVHAVDGVSFSLERGTTLGIVGESGSGKTVLARSIMRLLPRTNVRSSGTVEFAGRGDLMGLSDQEIRRICGSEIAMVFQDPMSSLNPVMTVGKQITEALRLHLGMSRRQGRPVAISLLRSVNIPEPERRFLEYPHQLSGGMRQRVMIALALACGPRLLFADEPTTALDVTVQAEILNLLQEHQADRFMAMVLVTHDLGVVAGRTDEIAVMYGGRIVEQAPTSTLFARMRHPYTEALLQSIPRFDDPSHTRLQAIGGRPPDLIDPPRGCAFSARCPYAQERCHQERPPLLTDTDPQHRFACFYPLSGSVGSTTRGTGRSAAPASAPTTPADDARAGTLTAGSSPAAGGDGRRS